MTSLIQLGESSDGQFTYLNGLIPKTKGVTIYDYFNNTFVSLPKLLKKQNTESNVEWLFLLHLKHGDKMEYVSNMGLINSIHEKEYTLSNYKENWLNDKLLFEYAASIDKNSKTTFFSHLSSHHQRILHIPKQLKTTSFHSLTHIQKN